MKIPLPESIPLNWVIILPAILLFGHLAVGTSFHFSVSFFVYFIYAIFAFNFLKGATSIGGLVILAMTVRNVSAQMGKIALGQPGDSNLLNSDLTVLLLAAGTTAIAAAAFLAQYLFPIKSAILGTEVNNERLKSLVLVFIGIRICTSILQKIESNSPGALGKIGAGLLTNFGSIGIICFALGTAYHLQISGKTKSLGWANAPLFVYALIETFLFGYKQTLIIPFLTYIMTCLAFQKKFRRWEIVALLTGSLATMPILYIYSQVVRSSTLTKLVKDSGEFTVEKILTDFSYSKFSELLDGVDRFASLSAETGYYGRPMGVLDRIAVPMFNADQVVHATEYQGDLGLEGIGAYFTILPKSITGVSAKFSKYGDTLAQFAGIIEEDNAHTFIEMDPAISTYAFGRWTGVILLNFLIFGLFFAVTNVVFGSIHNSPWAVAAFATCYLGVTSANITGGLVFVLRWVPFLLLLMYALGKVHIIKKYSENIPLAKS